MRKQILPLWLVLFGFVMIFIASNDRATAWVDETPPANSTNGKTAATENKSTTTNGGEKTATNVALPQPPVATLQQITIQGNVLSEAAELTILFDIHIHEDQAGWVRVPLGLREVAWQTPAEYEGPGEYLVHFSPEADEFICWLKGKANSRHRLTAKVVTSITRNGQDKKMSFSLPVAGASSLKLTLPSSRLQITQSIDTPAPTVTSKNDSTLIEVLGVKGNNYVLAWRELDQNTVSLEPVLEASGVQMVRIDDRTITTQAKLVVRSSGAEFNRFRVQLPPQSVLSGTATKGISISPVPSLNNEIVEVELTEKTVGPVEIPLQTERVLEVSDQNNPISFAGFKVLEALPHRQGGFIGFNVVGDWQLQWKKQNRVRTVSEIPNEPSSKEMTDIWKYIGQPFELEAAVVPLKTNIHLDADHKLQVHKTRATLESKLNYQLRGAKTKQLMIKMNGWILDDDIEPKSLVQNSHLWSGVVDELPITLQSPTTGNIAITLRMHRDFKLGRDSQVAFPLPVIQADSLGAVTLTTQRAENTELRPLTEKMVGLSPLTPAQNGNKLSSEGPSYRIEKQPAQFAAQVMPHSRFISATSAGKCQITPNESIVEQQFEFYVAYEPVRELIVTAGENFSRQSPIEWELDGRPINFVNALRFDEQTKQWQWVINLGEPRLGAVRLTVRCRHEHRLLPQASTALAIPLLEPAADKLISQEMILLPSDDVEIGNERLGTNWVIVGNTNHAERLQLHAANRTNELLLTLLPAKKTPQQAALVVERAWLQTWLAEGKRHERAVLRLRGATRPRRLTMPEGVNAAEAVLFWDGVEMPLHAENGREIVLDFAEPADSKSHVLDVRYRFQNAASSWSVTPEMPEVAPAVWVQQVQWQIVTPSHWHMLWGPSGMNLEAQWQWSSGAWGRVPTIDQRQLEEWSGGRNEAPIPSSWHTYVLNGLGSPPASAVTFLPRVLLLWSGAILGFALGWVIWRVKQIRHPASLLAIALVLIVLGASFPDPLLLLGQAAMFGLPLLILAALLRRLLRLSDNRPGDQSQSINRADRSNSKLAQLSLLGSKNHGSTATKTHQLERPVT